MRSLVLLTLVVGCGAAPPTAPVAFEVINYGPRAVVELGGTLGDAGVTGTAVLSTGESVRTPAREARVGDELRLVVKVSSASFEAPARAVPAEGLEVTATVADGGCAFSFAAAR